MKIEFIGLAMLLATIAGFAVPAAGQSEQNRDAQLGRIVGTAVNTNNGTVAGANVTLQGVDAADRRTVTTNEKGYFELSGVKPGVPYRVVIRLQGFADWTSPEISLEPGQFKILTDCVLHIQALQESVSVGYSSEEIAAAQLKTELSQRVFGIIPNFYVVYDSHPEPLTPKQKFKLAFKVVVDPVTVAGVAFYSGIQQWANTPDYQQGLKGYGERVGANAADGFVNIMVGGAIMPSLLHQDPRYFYQGTGTTKSRILHAISRPFLCKGDNGKRQPNYSSMLGDLTSGAIVNAYYPESNRGLGLTFGNFAIATASRMVAGLAQEFIVGRFTKKGKSSSKSTP